jgi:spore maturation protein CgeB
MKVLVTGGTGLVGSYVADVLEYKANMRAFEATGCGAFLLTEKPYGLEKLFTIGKELVARDEEELTDLVKFYLDAEDEREEVALRGMERALEKHTYQQRTMNLLLRA